MASRPEIPRLQNLRTKTVSPMMRITVRRTLTAPTVTEDDMNMHFHRWIVVPVLLLSAFASTVAAGDIDLDASFRRHVTPFLESHCVACHDGDDAEGGIDLSEYSETPQIEQNLADWDRVVRVLKGREMPPEGELQPSDAEFSLAVAEIGRQLDNFDCGSARHPGRVTIRRLNRVEYDNTIRDLVGIDFHPSNDFPSDDVGEGFDNIADVLALSPILVEKYLNAAEQIADKIYADDRALKRIMVHEPDDEVDILEATRRNFRLFADRAFRRPVTDEELNRILGVMLKAYQNGFSNEEIGKSGIQAVLVSPQFLFRVESDTNAEAKGHGGAPDGVRRLNDFEIASRLSYFLWSSMPDSELFGLAKKSKLGNAQTLIAQVRRMLQDPKASALVDNFAGQWLQLRDLDSLTPDTEKFVTFDDALRTAMRRETEMFFDAVMREDRSILEFLTADFTYVNERLASHYGMEGVHGDEFRRVQLGDRRRGILTHASILLLTSNPGRTSPVKRGKWILDNILGEPPSPPPADVPPLDEEADEIGTLRERMAQHRSNEACSVCHRKMDALGFGLENFDAIGAWRNRDGKFPIVASGSLPGNVAFDTPSELVAILADRKAEEFSRCLTKKMLTYGLGRGLDAYDRCAVNKIVEQLAENDYRFSSLITGIVLSEPFLFRALGND